MNRWWPDGTTTGQGGSKALQGFVPQGVVARPPKPSWRRIASAGRTAAWDRHGSCCTAPSSSASRVSAGCCPAAPRSIPHSPSPRPYGSYKAGMTQNSSTSGIQPCQNLPATVRVTTAPMAAVCAQTWGSISWSARTRHCYTIPIPARWSCKSGTATWTCRTKRAGRAIPTFLATSLPCPRFAMAGWSGCRSCVAPSR